MAGQLGTQQKVRRPPKEVVPCKIFPVMAEKRMQVREHLTLDGFMPSAHPILVVCEKCGNCATLREFVFPQKPKTMVWRVGNCSCLHCGHRWRTPAGGSFL